MQKDVIKVFVGCDPNNCDLEQMMVLEYSMKKHTTSPVEIIWMQLSDDANSFWFSDPQSNEGWNTSRWVTPFSGFRWAVPAYCNYEGKAIYMDADMLILSDLKDLWDHPFNEGSIAVSKGAPLMRRTCVTLWDCAKAASFLPKIEKIRKNAKSHKRLTEKLEKNPELVTPFNDHYNCLDGEDIPITDIKILHYTDIDTQFSHKYSIARLKNEGDNHWYDGQVNPHWRQDLVDLFDQYYQEALDAGYSLDSYRVAGFGNIKKESQKDYSGARHVQDKAIQKSGLLAKVKRLFKS